MYIHIDPMLSSNETRFPIVITTRAQVVAHYLEVGGALDVVVRQLEELQVQRGDGREAPAGDEDEGRLARVA